MRPCELVSIFLSFFELIMSNCRRENETKKQDKLEALMRDLGMVDEDKEPEQGFAGFPSS